MSYDDLICSIFSVNILICQKCSIISEEKKIYAYITLVLGAVHKLLIMVLLMYLLGRNEKGRHLNTESGRAVVKTKEYVWRQNKDYVEQVFDPPIDYM